MNLDTIASELQRICAEWEIHLNYFSINVNMPDDDKQPTIAVFIHADIPSNNVPCIHCYLWESDNFEDLVIAKMETAGWV